MEITPQIKAVLHNSEISVGYILPIFADEPDLLALTNTGTVTSDLLIEIYQKIAADNDDRPSVFSIQSETGKHTFRIHYPYNEITQEVERHIELIKAVE